MLTEARTLVLGTNCDMRSASAVSETEALLLVGKNGGSLWE
jgi:hypothetical protein